ncbi:ADP-ribosylation factor-like protein 14 [Synchiropus picturatus]
MGLGGSRQPEVRVLILGLDDAGKTTFLYRLKHKLSVETVPTIGFNVEMVEAKKKGKNILLTMWDVGGQDSMRSHWEEYYHDTAAVVFVLDSSARRGFGKARQELEKILKNDKLRGRPLILIANKQDVDTALTVTEIKERFNLRKICLGRDWTALPCSASTGVGVEEAFEHIVHLVGMPSDPRAMRESFKDTVHYLKATTTKH